MIKGARRGPPGSRPYTREEWEALVRKNPGLETVNEPPPPLDLNDLPERDVPNSIEK